MRELSILAVSCALIGAGCGSSESQPSAGNEDASAAADRPSSSRPALGDSTGESVANAPVRPGAPPRPTTRPTPFPVVSQRQMPEDPTALPLEPIAEEVATDEGQGEPVNPDDIPQEDDEILVPPQMLSSLFPNANFDAVTRTEPIKINSMLEQMGIVLTNYQQLIDMGLTNYQILRYEKEEGSSEQPQ